MLQIQKAIKRIIERFIAQMIPLTADASAGENSITIQSTRRFQYGDHVVVRNSGSYDAELHCVAEIPDHSTLVFEDELSNSWSSDTAIVQKLIGFTSGNTEFLKAVYLGDPAVIQQFPAITIDAKSRDSQWLTIESTRERYTIDISVYIDGHAYYDSQYELMHNYVNTIERSLFRSLYPLVKPYKATTLTEDADAGESLIKVADDDFFLCGKGWVFFESADYLSHNHLIEDLGSGAMRLAWPLARDFSEGDSVIHPLRHIFNALPKGTRYGTVNKGTMLKAAVISYECDEEVRRFTPFIDPLLS